MHCLPSRVTSWLTRTSRSGSFRAIGASTSRLPFTERPAQRQRCAPEPVAVLRPQSLAWDRHREIEGKFCKVVGGVVSPLLANLYFRRFVLAWEKLGRQRRLDAHIVNYADDFVICCRPGTGEAAMRAMRHLMVRLGLAVNDRKTRLAVLPEERFDFLGYTIGRFHRKGGRPISAPPLPRRRSGACSDGSTT